MFPGGHHSFGVKNKVAMLRKDDFCIGRILPLLQLILSLTCHKRDLYDTRDKKEKILRSR